MVIFAKVHFQRTSLQVYFYITSAGQGSPICMQGTSSLIYPFKSPFHYWFLFAFQILERIFIAVMGVTVWQIAINFKLATAAQLLCHV